MQNLLINAIVLICLFRTSHVDCGAFDFIDLPTSHLPFYFHNFPQIAEQCKQDSGCRYQKFLHKSNWNRNACWGYENDCPKENAFDTPTCHPGAGHSKDSMEINAKKFYKQTDFGNVIQIIHFFPKITKKIFPKDM